MQGSDNLKKIFYVRKTYDTHYALSAHRCFDIKALDKWEIYELHDIAIQLARDIESEYPEVIGKHKDVSPNHCIADCPENAVMTEDTIKNLSKLKSNEQIVNLVVERLLSLSKSKMATQNPVLSLYCELAISQIADILKEK